MLSVNALPPHRSQQLSALRQTGDKIFIMWIFCGGTVTQTTADRLCFYNLSYCVKSTPENRQESASIPQFLFYCFPHFHSCVWCLRR